MRALEERLALLSQASLRVNESLDFDTALQEVEDGTQALTASRYEATVPDKSRQPPDFFTKASATGVWGSSSGASKVGTNPSQLADPWASRVKNTRLAKFMDVMSLTSLPAGCRSLMVSGAVGLKYCGNTIALTGLLFSPSAPLAVDCFVQPGAFGRCQSPSTISAAGAIDADFQVL